jgi:hypothetical protein
MHYSWLGFVYHAAAFVGGWFLHSWGFWSDIIKVLGAAVAAPFIIGVVDPPASVTVPVKFNKITTAGKFVFTWDEQSFDVCEYHRKGLHWLWDALHAKRCRVVIKAGRREFTGVALNRQHLYHLVQTGKRTITIAPIDSPPRKRGRVTFVPSDAMNFMMWDFIERPGQTVYAPFPHKLRSPHNENLENDLEMR